MKNLLSHGSSALVFRASETNHASAGFLPTINQGQKPPETRNQRRPWLFLTLPAHAARRRELFVSLMRFALAHEPRTIGSQALVRSGRFRGCCYVDAGRAAAERRADGLILTLVVDVGHSSGKATNVTRDASQAKRAPTTPVVPTPAPLPDAIKRTYTAPPHSSCPSPLR